MRRCFTNQVMEDIFVPRALVLPYHSSRSSMSAKGLELRCKFRIAEEESAQPWDVAHKHCIPDQNELESVGKMKGKKSACSYF